MGFELNPGQGITPLRVNNALKAIDLIGNLANKRNYDYSEADYKRIIKSLKEAVNTVEQKFKGDGVKRFKL